MGGLLFSRSRYCDNGGTLGTQARDIARHIAVKSGDLVGISFDGDLVGVAKDLAIQPVGKVTLVVHHERREQGHPPRTAFTGRTADGDRHVERRGKEALRNLGGAEHSPVRKELIDVDVLAT